MMFFDLSAVVTVILANCALLRAAPSNAAKNSNGYTNTNVYCQPGQSCWPTDAEWKAFGDSLPDKVIAVKPWQDPCYNSPDTYDPIACAQIRLNYFDGATRSKYPGAAQTDNWAYCATNNLAQPPSGDCSLTASTTGQLLDIAELGTCKLGRLSPYAVNVTNADDVVRTLAFAQSRSPPIKVVIKNTGHEYLGRATSPNTLMIWTHNIQYTTFSQNFNGMGPALALGAGVSADQAYQSAFLHNMVITGGAYASVGLAGGFASGGGHGPFGPSRGLAVDNILQYSIVTVDGKLRTANANTNPDLFWAIRGGGGGSWGVVLETVYKLYPQTSMISVVYNLTLSPALQAGSVDGKKLAVGKIFAKMAQYQEQWTRRGWAGYNFFTVDQITFSQFLPSSDLVAAKSDMQDFITFITTNTDYISTPIALFTLIPNFEAWRNVFFRAGATNTPVAYAERLAGRLIPYQDFQTPQKQVQLAYDLVQSMFLNENSAQLGSDAANRPGDSFQIYSTGPKPADWGGPTGADTGVNTAWRSSLWEVVVNSAWTNKMSQANRNFLAQQTSKAGDYLRKHGTGCYYSEADVLEQNWQTAFFGNNYAQLLKIKQKYDPTNYLNVYKGIGYASQEQQAAFVCYQQA